MYNTCKPTDQWQYDEKLKLNQKCMLTALSKSLCVVSHALELIRQWELDNPNEPKIACSKNSHKDWIKNNEVYYQYFLDLKSDVKDFGESQLFKLMRGVPVKKTKETFDKKGVLISRETEECEAMPDKTAIIFFNKTQNKDRGYIERQEITTPDGITINGMAPIVLNVNQKENEADNT